MCAVEFTTLTTVPGGGLSSVDVACGTWPPLLSVDTVFTSSETPAAPSETLGSRRSVGLIFTSPLGGTVSAVRFYKGAYEGGEGHVGHIYDRATGARLASTRTFNDSGCAAGGWVRVALVDPLPVTPSRTYVAAVDNVMYFASSPEFFLASGRRSANGRIVVPRRGGVAGAVGAVPNTNFRDRNYWVDIELQS